MTEPQFTALLTLFINRATQLINRYCNVTSFEEHSIVEYYDGREPPETKRLTLTPTASTTERTTHLSLLSNTTAGHPPLRLLGQSLHLVLLMKGRLHADHPE